MLKHAGGNVKFLTFTVKGQARTMPWRSQALPTANVNTRARSAMTPEMVEPADLLARDAYTEAHALEDLPVAVADTDILSRLSLLCFHAYRFPAQLVVSSRRRKRTQSSRKISKAISGF